MDAITHSPYETGKMPSLQHRATKLTVRACKHDFIDFQEIGRGFLGKVYKCYRKIDLCPYAIKQMKSSPQMNKERGRILREIYAHACQKDNIHIVRYFNAWEEEDALYIQTELCAGTLGQMRDRQGRFGESILKDVMVQIASGLAYMHAHNLAHLDVRPDNLYWTDRGIYKLGGFGLITVDEAANHVEQSDKRYLRCVVLYLCTTCLFSKCSVDNLGGSHHVDQIQA